MLLMNMLILVINVFTLLIVASFVAVAVFSCGMFYLRSRTFLLY